MGKNLFQHRLCFQKIIRIHLDLLIRRDGKGFKIPVDLDGEVILDVQMKVL